MKVICIGDTHGRDTWKKIVEKESDVDMFVFLGDYFDSKETITTKQQLDNFNEIIEYKKSNMDKVVLLIGNHDYHYLNGVKESYSGYQFCCWVNIGGVLDEAIKAELLQMCYVHGKFVMTHAGITNTWATANEIDKDNIQESVNDLFKFKPLKFGFTPGVTFSNYGDDITQTPIWVRPESLQRDRFNDKTYVVGHTMCEKLVINDDIICIDTLVMSGEYLIINNDVPSIGKV